MIDALVSLLRARLGTTGTIHLVNTSLVDSNSNEAISVSTTASAVNHLVVTNAATTDAPVLAAAGDDTNVSLVLTDKGTASVMIDAPFLYAGSPASVTTAGAGTYSVANLLTGYILRSPSGAARTDTTATAAQIVAAIPDCRVGMSMLIAVKNTSSTSGETITIAGGTSVSVVGTATVAIDTTRLFKMVITNVTGSSEAVSLYSLGALTH